MKENAVLPTAGDCASCDYADVSDLEEQLLRLYLRLNGFFTSGFIVHSAQNGRNKTEIDTIAVRFPHSREPERNEPPDPWLQVSDKHVELAICEVKTSPKFNEALYNDSDAIKSVLRWTGMFDEATLSRLAPEVQSVLTPDKQSKPEIRRTEPHNNIVVRALLFCPQRPAPSPNQSWFVGSDAALPFLVRCLSPQLAPASCARNYGANQWAELSRLVRFFKSWARREPPSFADLVKAFTFQQQVKLPKI